MDDQILEFCLSEISEYLKMIHNEYFMYHDKPNISHLKRQLTSYTRNILSLQNDRLKDHLESRRKDYIKTSKSQKEKI